MVSGIRMSLSRVDLLMTWADIWVLIEAVAKTNKIVHVKCGKFDKYGRLLVYITIDNININNHLVEKGYAYKYKGGTKMDFNIWNKVTL